jgi:archaeosine-15-forming tRNA-guanine transglycosylase
LPLFAGKSCYIGSYCYISRSRSMLRVVKKETKRQQSVRASDCLLQILRAKTNLLIQPLSQQKIIVMIPAQSNKNTAMRSNTQQHSC